jgi:hypothetical protein
LSVTTKRTATGGGQSHRVTPLKTACFVKHSSAVLHSGAIPIGTVVTLFDNGSAPDYVALHYFKHLLYKRRFL